MKKSLETPRKVDGDNIKNIKNIGYGVWPGDSEQGQVASFVKTVRTL
jgi:hypothetical protein